VRRSLDVLGLDDVAVVGHDSGGMIARHAIAGDVRLRAMGLIDTESSGRSSLKFRSFVAREFDEFFLKPLARSREHRAAAMKLFRSFDHQLVRDLGALHPRIDVPVVLVWGEHDRFFPVHQARAMVSDFPHATLEVIEGAGLFSHEERPAEVARALLPTLLTHRT
jgi:haloalkane dehalogenase